MWIQIWGLFDPKDPDQYIKTFRFGPLPLMSEDSSDWLRKKIDHSKKDENNPKFSKFGQGVRGHTTATAIS